MLAGTPTPRVLFILIARTHQKKGPALRWAQASKVKEEEKNCFGRVLNMRQLGSLRLIIIKKVVLPAARILQIKNTTYMF